MRRESDHWIQMGPAASPAEQHALDRVRELLPETPSTYAWANLTFIDLQGRTNELDVLLWHGGRLTVLELKGWAGSIAGNQQTWRRTLPGGQIRIERNPHLLNDSKAKRLASYLKSLLPKPAANALPFIDALTVLHGQGSSVSLDATGKVNTYGLDGYQVAGVPALSEWIAEPRGQPDNATNSRIVKLLHDAGFAETPRQRLVGPYAIEGDPVGEGASWVDYMATHPVIAKQKRRIRLFDAPRNATAAQRARVQHLAKREFLLTNGLSHPGVVGPLEIYDLESGPALIFADDSTDAPLVDYLADNQDRLCRADRLALIRQLAEVIRFAHEHRVVHRALTPFTVFVAQGPAGPLVRVRDWQTGRAESDGLTGSQTSSATVHVASAVVQDSWVWLAPEAQAEAASGVELDVYGLGVVAYLILTGAPPATNVVELQARLAQGGGLDPRVHADVEVPLADLVADATRGDVSARTPDVAWFIEALNEAESVHRVAVDEVGEAVDPLAATPADLIADRWLVDERLGSGGTGIALLAYDTAHDDRAVVLKVAHDESRAERLEAEAAVLSALDHPRIVRVLEGPLTVGQRRMLVLEDAGRPTLGGRISNEGRLTIEQLATYGSDLFDIAAYLDAQGRFHRDIKPENLGVREASSAEGRRPSLVLFDFSLSTEPLEHTKSGTRGYLDPFLGTKERPRYDRAAERFAIAATLYQMATGQRPEWGDGVSDPPVIRDEVTLDPTSFDQGVADDLVPFFSRALARDSRARFDSLADMAAEWARIFATLEVRDPADEEAAQEARDSLAAAAALTTRLAESGLTRKATSAAARLGAETVGELIGLNAARINNAPGLGVAVRRELQDRRRQWRDALTAPTTTQEEPPGAVLGVEAIAAALVPKPNGRNADTIALARQILLIDPRTGELASFPWPTLEQVTESLGMDLARGRAAIDGLERHWAKATGMAATIRRNVRDALDVLGGIATSDEIADRFVATMGSTADGPRRRVNAAALVRAAVESDLALDPDQTTIAALRHPHQTDLMLLAAADGPKGTQAPARLAAAVALAKILDAELERTDLVTSVAATDLLTSDPAGAALAVDDSARALGVAAAASRMAAVSSRGELYRRDLPPARMVAAVLASATVGVIAPNRLVRLAADRFPAGAPLPGRPALDALVQAESSLRWDGSAYSRPSDPSSMLISSTRATTSTPAGLLPHAEIDARLQASLDARSGTVLAVEPRLVAATAGKLADRFGVRSVDVTAEILASMHRLAETNGVDWSLVLRSDAAGPREPDRMNLNRLVMAALDDLWPALMATSDPLVLHSLGPLARYGHLKRLAELIDLTSSRPAARWVLVGHRPSADAPSIDGVAVPLGASGWIDIPIDLFMTPLSRRPAS